MNSDSQPLTASTTIVVGGAGALGAPIVDRLIDTQHGVVVLDRTPSTNPKALFLKTDITDPVSVQRSFEQIKKRSERCAGLVVASGILRSSAFLDLTDSDLQAHLDVNLLGAFRVAQAAARLMQTHGGRMVFITSIHGQIGVPDRAAYAMSKAGVGALVRAMAVELAPFNIRVNALAPGAIDGGMSPNAHTRQYWRDQTPSHRVAHIEEVVNATLMLMSNEASFLSGQTIALDGGVSTSRILA